MEHSIVPRLGFSVGGEPELGISLPIGHQALVKPR